MEFAEDFVATVEAVAAEIPRTDEQDALAGISEEVRLWVEAAAWDWVATDEVVAVDAAQPPGPLHGHEGECLRQSAGVGEDRRVEWGFAEPPQQEVVEELELERIGRRPEDAPPALEERNDLREAAAHPST